MTRRSRLSARPLLESLDQRLVLSTQALTPLAIETAYGLNSVTYDGTTLTGAGQTIAIIDAYNDPNAAAELKTFDAKYNLPAASLTVDNLGSARNTNAGWEEEEALDIETAHLAAPGAKILLIEATSDSTQALMAAVNVADHTAGVTVVSMSWGGSDTGNETQYDVDFTTPGITYLAASGDSGTRGGAEWPSDSPNVIAVGGTTLSVTTADARATEAAWSDSGGGYSSVETEPAYQDKAQSTGSRSTPDVSADADPDTGLMVYSVASGGWEQIGGTSLATPIWAGLIAEADQGRVLAGKSTLGYSAITTSSGTVDANLALYGLYYAPSGSFNDITSGNSTTGYNTSTGLGTPNAKTLIPALISDTASNVTTVGGSTVNGVGGDPVPTTTGGGTTGGGTTGGGTTGGGTGGGGFPTPPPWFPWRHGFYGSAGSSSGTPSGWAGTFVPRNSGQSAPEPYQPITLIPIHGSGSTRTAPKATKTPKSGTAPETHTSPEKSTGSDSSTTAHHKAVDKILHGLGHRRA